MTIKVTGWRTSSFSGSQGGNCVEVAGQDRRVLVRDTKQTGAGPVLMVLRRGLAQVRLPGQATVMA